MLLSTISPAFTNTSKGSPFKLTVSMPIWTKTSIPQSFFNPIACFVGKTDTTSPYIGE